MNNKRIKELIEQADVVEWGFNDKTGDFSPTNLEKLEKFTELIIKECTIEIQKQGDGENLDSWDRGYHSGLNSAIEAIKKHFGVENANQN